MIYKSSKNKNYADFDWQSYSKYYSYLKKEGFYSKDHFWWHYVTLGEQSNYRFFDLKERKNTQENNLLFDETLYAEYYPFLINYGLITKEQLWQHYIEKGINEGYIYFNKSYEKNNWDEFAMFDEYKYLLLYPFLYEENIKTKEELFNHYLTVGKNKGYRYCTIHESENFDEVEVLFPVKRKKINNKKTIYYFINSTIKHIIRSGIQVVSIYLAKKLLKETTLDIVFVKWNPKKKSIVPCSPQEIDFFLNYNESTDLVDPIHYEYYQDIHLNNYRPLKNCLFLCPEVTFSSDNNIPNFLQNYLYTHNIKSTYILYDIIPLILPKYNLFEEGFTNYLKFNLLNANKLITISDFTKTEFENYTSENKLKKNTFPIVKSIPLPYQYRNKERIYPLNTNVNTNDKVTILVPGTVEPRKQQVLLLQIFNQFVENNPTVEVELILFGTITAMCKADVQEEIEKSKGKIINLGIINNEILSDYYQKASFCCFISIYEVFGFPISESLWHGVPVLTSNFGSMKEVANLGGCFTVNTQKEEEIYRALDTLIKNPNIINNLKQEISDASLSTWDDYSDCIVKELI